jgi:VWFA-related protein
MIARAVILASFAAVALTAPPAPRHVEGQQPAAPPPTQAQQRPVFRGGTHFVRVDAYPSQNGKIVEGLTAEDFEILEDGKPQKIESLDFIKFDTFTPDAVRRDPQSQREGFDLAADPRYRLFVIYVDMTFSSSQGPFAPIPNLPNIQQPLVNFLDRIIGPGDLYGFLTSRNSVKDLVLAQKTLVTSEQIKDLWRASIIDRDEADEVFAACPPSFGGLKARYNADQTYSNLRDLVYQMGSLRQERKNVVFVSNLLPRWRADTRALNAATEPPPRIGGREGRVVLDDRETSVSGKPGACMQEMRRLMSMDFDRRYMELLRDAKRENVSFYVITPGGLQAPTTVAGTRAVDAAYDDMRSLADETDGLAVVNTNDLNAGMKKIADDLAAYYVLGYYTTNTKFDGGLRTLKVRYKGSGAPIRARRQYRAPTEEEIARLASSSARSAVATQGPSPLEIALTALERGSRPFAVYTARTGSQLTVVTELSAASIQSAKWKGGADLDVEVANAAGAAIATSRGRIEPGAYSAVVNVGLPAGSTPDRLTVRLRGDGEVPASDWMKLPSSPARLVGDPIAYRAGSRIASRPVATFEFARNERIRAEWPVTGTLERREVRLLDRSGKALPVEIPLSEDADKKALVVEMSLSGLGRGDYVLELTAGAAAAPERKLLAIRVK